MVFASYTSVKSFNSEKRKTTRGAAVPAAAPGLFQLGVGCAYSQKSRTVCLRLLISYCYGCGNYQMDTQCASMTSYFWLLKYIEFPFCWGKVLGAVLELRGKAHSALPHLLLVHILPPQQGKIFRGEIIWIFFLIIIICPFFSFVLLGMLISISQEMTFKNKQKF